MPSKEVFALDVGWAHTFRSCDWIAISLRELQLKSFDDQGAFNEARFRAALSRIRYTPAPISLLSSPTNYDLFLRVPIPEEAKSLRDAIKRMAKTFLVDTFYGGNRYRLPLPAQDQEAQLNLFARPPDPEVFASPAAFVDSREALDWIRNSDLQFRRPPTARSIWEAVESLRTQERGASMLDRRRSAMSQLHSRYAQTRSAGPRYEPGFGGVGDPAVPPEVLQVTRALKKNLSETLVGRKAREYIYSAWDEEEQAWQVGVDQEGHDTFIYKDGTWYLRQWWGFADDELLGDLQAALEAASMFFTG